MKSNHFIDLIFFTLTISLVTSEISFLYEKLYNKDYPSFGNKMRNYRRQNSLFNNKNAYPEPLPTPRPALPYVHEKIYQGVRRKGDKRVFNQNFNYTGNILGHRIYTDGVFDCILTHLAVETNGGVPMILRGGVGYRFFNAVAKAKPMTNLAGRIRAYCVMEKEKPKLG